MVDEIKKEEEIKAGDTVYDKKGTGKVGLVGLVVERIENGKLYFKDNKFPYNIEDFSLEPISEAKKPERQEIVLMAKIDKDGMLVEEIPHDQRICAFLLLHLNSRVQSRHMTFINTVKKMEDERKKPNIITSIKNSPIIRGLYK